MDEQPQTQHVEIARFYTRSRKFPRLIGRLHDGTKIPGGPYTITQGVVFAILLTLGLATRGLWGTGSILIDLPLTGVVAWGGAWGAGRLPATRRNAASLLLGALGAMTRTGAGRYLDRTVRLRPPHKAGGFTAVTGRSGPTSAPHSPPAVPATPAPPRPAAPAAPRQMAVSGVERLLAQARGSKKE